MTRVVSRDEWKAAVEKVHERERELERIDEEIAKERQELPWVRVDKEYAFDTARGRRRLPHLLARNADFPLRRHDEY
jgi:predicted dithiol-disulfide oxidoreductase (DUF899 family)